MYKVIDITDDFVSVLNLENLQVMKINKSKIGWDVKINDYIDFKFTDDNVIVVKVENNINKKEDINTVITDNDLTQKDNSKHDHINSNTLSNQNNTKDIFPIANTNISKNKTNPTTWIGVALAFFIGLLGLLIGILCCNNDEDKSALIRGWFTTFITIIVGIIFLLLLYFLIMATLMY